MRTLILMLAVLGIASCSGSPEDAQAAADAKAMTVTTPDATAEDHQKGLANADMPDHVKKVLGGAGK